MFSRKNLPLFFYLTFAMLSIHRNYALPEQKSTADDAKITEISLLELPETGELYEMVPQVVSNEENPTTEASQTLPPMCINGVPFIFKQKFYYPHKKWFPKAYVKGNFYKMGSNNAKCKFIFIKQYESNN
ncbi:hypothetical protein C1646_798606 [Rhizophagus diaphanus]|nr:hypothetical protein C1646_798606 [Rhizophagus diaphanus] [Rhizophagus sp. MUCL 43196]